METLDFAEICIGIIGILVTFILGIFTGASIKCYWEHKNKTPFKEDSHVK